MLLYRYPDSPLTWSFWDAARDYDQLRELMARFFQGSLRVYKRGGPEEETFGQVMASCVRAGYLPTEAAVSREGTTSDGRRYRFYAMTEGVITSRDVLERLLAAAALDGLTTVVHHRDQPGPVNGIDIGPSTFAPTLGHHVTLQRLARRENRLGAPKFAAALTDLWQVTVVADDTRLLWKALDAFSGRSPRN
ncbi:MULTISPECIES: DUF6919 domain-containing protein [Streptomyces]|uniref:DUF6919 domain-containing protein n=1 Tax=Streptomyces griseiscabiei TaxID=2993540 RepID=A0ABU4LJW9_9ACTN|nr:MULTISPECIES: hypothetical protein [Streptomyces]MBP5866102.1 hypothetical protein [Streptomyces sp. LBUM 1484]MBZ3908842.1 hypothetical protein [Streptomyces griseiscabiei]MDX2567525.1 hypothetical protein [Streptomyces scabiei]MDX2916117.1 hypothetical protein [Streptomyces griseiscabiei]